MLGEMVTWKLFYPLAVVSFVNAFVISVLSCKYNRSLWCLDYCLRTPVNLYGLNINNKFITKKKLPVSCNIKNTGCKLLFFLISNPFPPTDPIRRSSAYYTWKIKTPYTSTITPRFAIIFVDKYPHYLWDLGSIGQDRDPTMGSGYLVHKEGGSDPVQTMRVESGPSSLCMR